MTASALDNFCGSKFWDVALSWHTTDPDFTPCFEKTVLFWIPCLFLWLLSPMDWYYISRSKAKLIPWGFLNVTKLTLMGALIILSTADFLYNIVLAVAGEVTYGVNLWTPALKMISFSYACLLLIWNKSEGLRTSAVLFIFWLVLAITGAAQFRTEIRKEINGVLDESLFHFVTFMISYPIIILLFFLNFFADGEPTFSEYPKVQKACPELSASFFSKLVFHWFDKMAWNGFRRDLKPEDLWNMRHQDSAAEVIPQFDKHWIGAFQKTNKSAKNNYGSINTPSAKRRKTPVVTWALWKAFGHTFLFGAVMKLLGDMCAFIQPQILKLLIAFVTGKEYMWRGYMYVVLLLVVAEIQTFFITHYIMTMSEVGLRVRTALISAIYRKALLMSNSAHKESTVGEIVNLMAVDAQRFIELTAYINMIWAAPLTIGLAFYFLWQFLGPSAAAGLIVMFILIPLNMFIANKIKLLQIKQMRYKDERVKLMNEILCGIKVLKLYAWEPSFEEQILAIRDKEVRVLRKAALLNASTAFIWTCTPLLVSLVTFGVYVLSDKRNVIDSQTAFVSLSLINIMRTPIAQLPMLISVLVQAGVSLRRINNFMNTEELDLNSVSHDASKDEPLIMENGVFTWDGVQRGSIILRNISMTIKEGALVAIVGTVGSGKSSLINAFLGEMDKVSGYVNVKGKKSYVPQQAWIQNATLKDNILFGYPMVEKKYKEVVKACALQSDFDMLPSGDMTEIGEKGINLSGGQKQRVSLARAVYNDSDIYFLDDPLSAVDSHVGKHIFENVIGPKGMLRKKTRLLVTHSVTFLPEVDYIYVLRGGEVIECGTYKQLLAEKGEFADFLVQHLTEIDDPDQETDIEEMLAADPDLKARYHRTLSHLSSRMSMHSMLGRRESVSSRGSTPLNKQLSVDQLIQVEQSETGSVKWSVYYHYLRSIGVFLVASTILFNVLAQTFQISSNIWLSVWSSDKTTIVNGVQDSRKRNLYIGVYALFGFGQLICSILCSFALAIGTLLAARWLHLTMLANIFHAPMSFFDTTPTGRVVNRFSKDIDIVDNTLPNNISAFLNCFFQVLGTLIVVAYSTPLFLAIIIPVGILYYFIQRFYVSTSRQLKRLESVSRSPIYSHFSESVTGAASIRAYGVQDRFVKGSSNRVDNNQIYLYPSMVSNRWLGTRLETVGNLVIFFAALFSVLDRDNLDPGVVGLSVSYALQVTSILNYCVRMTSEVETNIVAVERIQEYALVPQEAAWWLKPAPDPTWPNQGKVEFKDYQVRYRKGLELVLKGISFVVNGGEKIGIVGRTGAGKSSLTLCLFRILEAAGGSIHIDGLDISALGLNDLRSRLTIIPQDPILFSGTLRINLDPFKKCKDEDIWRALDLAHLSYFARNLPNGLDHQISEGGENLSVGQRQLLCLARALLRKTKVLILDEATAAVDLETDDLIQRTIRSEFKGCTVLTIAHRLNTILDSDRVIVLDKGYLKEFDPPSVLLKKKTSIFYGMARDAGLI